MDDGPEVHALFLDISKAFDRVGHRPLLIKLIFKLSVYCGQLSATSMNVEFAGRMRCGIVSADHHRRLPQGSALGPLAVPDLL